jgi:Putative collagen-binding domain of a collagenase
VTSLVNSGAKGGLIVALALVLAFGAVAFDGHSAEGPQPAPATGPLRVHPKNPRYFTDGSGKAIYLAGLQGGWEMQDDAWGGYAVLGTRVVSDFDRYLRILEENNLNYIRLWNVETTRWDKGPAEMVAAPMPYVRTGPGNALDGQPKFDLDQFDIGNLASPQLNSSHFFERLRARVIAARDRGIYVMIMLFEGFSCVRKSSSYSPHQDANPWEGHPFNAKNNIQGANGDVNGDGMGREIHTLSPSVQGITARQKAYVRKIIDTVNDLDNVLYEIANESFPEANEWQYEMISTIKSYQATKPKQQPILMSCSLPKQTNQVLWASQADAIAPCSEGKQDYRSDPPAAGGKKVVIADADHIIWTTPDPRFVWKNFLRGNNPVIFDWGLVPFDWNLGKVVADHSAWKPPRRALGYTRSYANKMNLAAMTPSAELASTSYCLANPGREYLVYQPGSGAFTVKLSAGTYASEWFNPGSGSVTPTGSFTTHGENRSFSPPFSGDAILYLKISTPEAKDRER